MSDDEMNIAICEARGWTRGVFGHPKHGSDPSTWVCWVSPTGVKTKYPPDHINGREALQNMCEAEETLTESERAIYLLRLGPLTTQRLWEYVRAPARERAIAWLHAKSLYIEAT